MLQRRDACASAEYGTHTHNALEAIVASDFDAKIMRHAGEVIVAKGGKQAIWGAYFCLNNLLLEHAITLQEERKMEDGEITEVLDVLMRAVRSAWDGLFEHRL
jgi:hypothetical protein